MMPDDAVKVDSLELVRADIPRDARHDSDETAGPQAVWA